MQTRGKLNRLEKILPEGLLIDATRLEREGYSRALRSQYVAAGWLEQPTRGVFRRPRGSVSWEQVVISLQTLLETPVSIGGRTALELQGYAHYLPHVQNAIHLHSECKLPVWLHKLQLKQRFVTHNRLRLFPAADQYQQRLSLDTGPSEEEITLKQGLRLIRWGQWNWPLVISSPERAYLELLDELPHNETFHLADVIMEGLLNLSPRRMQTLLEIVQSVKVKRLFFFFAQRHAHSWLDWIDQSKIDLGQGKRVLIKGGKLDRKFLITVPEELIDDAGYGLE